MTDEEYRALQEQSHMLEELRRHPGWPVLVDYVETYSKGERLRVLRGGLSHDEYQHQTGYLSGLFRVLDAPEKVSAMLTNEVNRRVEHDEPVT